MNETLRNIYLHLDKRAATLTKSALQQIIIKVLFGHDDHVKPNVLYEDYKSAIKRKDASYAEFEELLNALYDSSQIHKDNHGYYLSTSKKKKIQSACDESKYRKERLIEKYFSNLYSDSEAIKNWLEDVTIHFFQLFSNDWISDLLNQRNSIASNEKAVRDVVVKRTEDVDYINKHDRIELVDRFFSFVTSISDADVNAYLWEYGTSAFSAKLISSQKGVDSLTLDTFRNAHCILDTNILMFIALETNKFHRAIESIELAFESLNISAGYFYITKQEYQNRVLLQKESTLRNLERYGYDTVIDASDDFTQTAKLRGCRESADFNVFFEQIYELPKFIKNKVEIKIIDDASVNEAIEDAQKDDAKIDRHQNVFTEATGHNKRHKPLIHDVGLVAGVEYLREEDSYFILSEEIGINTDSKKKPTINNLPLSLRVLTLINVLAIDNGGIDFNANDYMPLFASIIKNGLQPDKNAFEQVDLYKLYEIDENIAKLPATEVKAIAQSLHSQMLKGEDNEQLRLDLQRQITKGEIAVKRAIADKDIVIEEKSRELQREKDRGDRNEKTLRSEYRRQETEKYDKHIKDLKRSAIVRKACAIGLICTVLLIATTCFADLTVGVIATIVCGLIVNWLSDKFSYINSLQREIKVLEKQREENIEHQVNYRMTHQFE